MGRIGMSCDQDFYLLKSEHCIPASHQRILHHGMEGGSWSIGETFKNGSYEVSISYRSH